MNYNMELSKLICKYHIDKPFPKYQMFLKAIEIVKNTYEELKKQYPCVVLVGTDKTDIEWFKKNVDMECSEEWLYNEKTCRNLPERYEKLQIENRDGICFLILSYYWRNEVFINIRNQKDGHVIDLYDVFENQGLYFDNDFYFIFNTRMQYKEKNSMVKEMDMNAVFFYFRRKYEELQEQELKNSYLQKIIFICAFMKDFVLLKQYVKEYQKLYKDERAAEYASFYSEIEKLLNQMKEKLAKRQQKDCILTWLDALEYGDDEGMPFLKGIDEKALVFEKAFTVTPYTWPTFETLFAKKRLVEDEAFKISYIDKGMCNLILELEKRNYNFKYYGYVLPMSPEMQAPHYYDKYRTITELYWDALVDILIQDDNKACFFVLHELLATHHPFISFGIKGKQYIDENTALTNALLRQQQKESREYVDSQLKFYANLLPSKMYKLYMSDHGRTYFGRVHPILKIQQEAIQPMHFEGLVSYYDFDKILLCVLDNCIQELSKIACQYVIIQNMDTYNKETNRKMIKSKSLKGFQDWHMEFLGVVTEQDLMIRFRNGIEYYAKLENDEKLMTDERVNYLKTFINPKYTDIEKEEKLKYARIMQKVFRKCEKRTEPIERKKKEVIRKFFESISPDEVLAIRGGGRNTYRALLLLKEELRKKVSYVIDNDLNCIAGKLGIKIIPADEMNSYKPDIILMITCDNRSEWKEELNKAYKDFTGKIIDLYDLFESEGIFCQGNFYDLEYADEDFEGIDLDIFES